MTLFTTSIKSNKNNLRKSTHLEVILVLHIFKILTQNSSICFLQRICVQELYFFAICCSSFLFVLVCWGCSVFCQHRQSTLQPDCHLHFGQQAMFLLLSSFFYYFCHLIRSQTIGWIVLALDIQKTKSPCKLICKFMPGHFDVLVW